MAAPRPGHWALTASSESGARVGGESENAQEQSRAPSNRKRRGQHEGEEQNQRAGGEEAGGARAGEQSSTAASPIQRFSAAPTNRNPLSGGGWGGERVGASASDN